MASESELLAHIYERSKGLSLSAGFACGIGPGDDAAVVTTPSGDRLVLTVDQVVVGRHVTPATPPDLIARKAVARSLSDLAAMGATPAFGLATGLLPDGFTQGDELFDCCAKWASQWGCPLVGGDIAFGEGALSLTVTLVGRLEGEGLLVRSSAAPGDGVYVTGELGYSYPSKHHLWFEPRLQQGRELRAHTRVGATDEKSTSRPKRAFEVGACLDVSDGLGRDAGRLALASGVRIELDASRLPRRSKAGWRDALQDGEDYELLFTALGTVPAEIAGVRVTRIGGVVPGTGCVARLEGGEVFDASEKGWEHGEKRAKSGR